MASSPFLYFRGSVLSIDCSILCITSSVIDTFYEIEIHVHKQKCIYIANSMSYSINLASQGKYILSRLWAKKTLVVFACLFTVLYNKATAQEFEKQELIYFDTTVNYIDSKSKTQQYLIKLVVDSSNNKSINSLFTINIEQPTLKILADSIFSSYPQLLFKDVNRDQHSDILVFHKKTNNEDEFYYLYVYNKSKTSFIRVTDFEKLRNPSIDKAGIICSCPSILQENCNYYVVDNNYKLVQLL